MIRAGELKEKLLFQRPNRVSNGSGGFETTYTELLRTYGKVVEQRSVSNLVANQDNIYNYIHFQIRYRPLVPIKIGDRLVWRGFNFIVNNIKVDPSRTQIDIFLNSEIETSQRQDNVPNIIGFTYQFPLTLS